MKERYFNLPDTTNDALALLEQARVTKISNIKLFHLDRAALLVLDMQNYFLEESSHAFIPSAPAIVGNILSLIELFQANNRPVFTTRHTNTQKDAGMMKVWWKEIISSREPQSKIIPEIERLKLPCIEKFQYDAFCATDLAEVIRRRRSKQLVITGVMTHLCCETTARCAFVQGWEVFFPIDGTATYNRQFHCASLLNLSHGFAHISTVGDLLKAGSCG